MRRLSLGLVPGAVQADPTSTCSFVHTVHKKRWSSHGRKPGKAFSFPMFLKNMGGPAASRNGVTASSVLTSFSALGRSGTASGRSRRLGSTSTRILEARHRPGEQHRAPPHQPSHARKLRSELFPARQDAHRAFSPVRFAGGFQWTGNDWKTGRILSAVRRRGALVPPQILPLRFRPVSSPQATQQIIERFHAPDLRARIEGTAIRLAPDRLQLHRPAGGEVEHRARQISAHFGGALEL